MVIHYLAVDQSMMAGHTWPWTKAAKVQEFWPFSLI